MVVNGDTLIATYSTTSH